VTRLPMGVKMYEEDSEEENAEVEEQEESSERVEEPPAPEPQPHGNLDAKVKSIMESKLPESEKQAYLVRLGVIKEEKQTGIPFKVWAKIRKIPHNLHEAMIAWPRVKGREKASLQEWDKLFKDF